MSQKVKNHFQPYRSPLRWAFLGLLVAVFLFFWEISLSYYSLYLTLAGGGAVVGIEWLHNFLAGLYLWLHGFFAIGALAILIVIILLARMWLKQRDTGEEDIIIREIKKDIASVRKDISKIKKDVKRQTR